MECSICFDVCKKPVRFECGHQFHTSCVSKWLLLKNTCPYCRDPIYECSDFEEDDEFVGTDIECVNETLMTHFGDKTINRFNDYLEYAVEDIENDVDVERGWKLESDGTKTIEVCIKSKEGYIWTEFIYLPFANRLLVCFNEYKIYIDRPRGMKAFKTRSDLDIECVDMGVLL